MRTGKPPAVYWDTAPLISLIKGEKRDEKEVEGLELVVDEHSKGGLVIFTSVITRTEIYLSKLNPLQRTMYDSVTQRGDFIEFPVDRQIAERAREIREITNLKAPDALHLATALINEAEEFHTFDAAIIKLGKRKAFDAFRGEMLICRPGFGDIGKQTTRRLFSEAGEPRCGAAVAPSK